MKQFPPCVRRILPWLALLPMLFLISCAKWKKQIPRAVPVKFPSTARADGASRQPVIVGTIRMVSEGDRFVMIETEGYAPPDAGLALKCFREGVEVGVVAVTAERRRQFFTADIVSGNPQRGDKVLH